MSRFVLLRANHSVAAVARSRLIPLGILPILSMRFDHMLLFPSRRRLSLLALPLAFVSVSILNAAAVTSSATVHAPLFGDHPDYNILFVILDDVGADQLTLSNPAGVGLASTPTINAIAAQGVNFSNCWATPQCSPSRTCFFTGRYPSRTGVVTALTAQTLPQSQCSPYETTTPMILGADGYHCKLVGKFHLSQEDLNPAGIAAPASNGFTDFNGTLLGGPPFIDPTIAGQVDSTTVVYSCGFPVSGSAPAICACAFPNGDCTPGVNALECLAAGGLPLVASDGTPILECSAEAAARIDWTATNGSYAWPRTINRDGAATQVIPVRKHADVVQADDAITFINEQRSHAGAKWMCTLSFTGDHDPWQPPQQSSLPPGTVWPEGLAMACDVQPDLANPTEQQRIISNWTIESLDVQLRRVLLATNLATLNKQGALTLNAPDTVIVVVGDNGSFLNTVRGPFNPLRAKATAYQSGICVPLVAAGGPTVAPGRRCDEMVNVVDLFQLWGECANVNVNTAVPVGRKLDCRPMLRYLTSANAPAAREWNFSEYASEYLEAPCYPCLIIASSIDTCTDTILTSESLCNSQGGVWYGPTATAPAVASTCCELLSQQPAGTMFNFIYAAQQALTDGRWKIVYSDQPTCMVEAGVSEYEFYDLSQCFAAHLLWGRGIDNPSFNLLAPGTTMTKVQQFNYNRLLAKMTQMQASLQHCDGDITMNGIVNGDDAAALLNYWGMPSVADINNDGATDGADLAILLDAWGPCPG